MPPIDLAVLAAFAAFWIVIVPTPGPNSLMVTHMALTQGWRQVAAALAGNTLGSATLATSALLGMAALLAAFPWLRTAIYGLGGAYLVWVGLRLLRRGWQSNYATAAVGGAGDTAGLPPMRLRRAFASGLATALSNAQAVMFITSIFAATGVLEAGIPTGLVVVVMLCTMNGTYLATLGWLLQRPAARRAYMRFRNSFEALVGVLFIGFGVRLVLRELA